MSIGTRERNLSRNIVVAIVASLCVLCTSDVQSEAKIEIAWACSSQSFAREIELYKWDQSCDENVRPPEGHYACRVLYKKDGESEVLWQAMNVYDYCEPKARALVASLQASGFECVAAENSSSCDENEQTAVTEKGTVAQPVTVTANRANEGGKEKALAELRRLLEKHYQDNYLEAMIDAVPPGFTASPDQDVVSSGSGERLHVAPPNHFVSTSPDGSYVLVNTSLLEHGTTSSYVNFGFLVKDKLYRFLGYATSQSVGDVQVLAADRDKIVMSVIVNVADSTGSCAPGRRTKTIPWHPDMYGGPRAPQDEAPGGGDIADCGR